MNMISNLNQVRAMLSNDDKQRLLEIARDAIEFYALNKSRKEYKVISGALKTNGAAFVTIKIDDKLRGCIGRVEARLPLYKCVREMAIGAAFEDPRFTAIQKDDIYCLQIEISVLTDLIPVLKLDDVLVGRDGLVVRSKKESGLLLPQVATEWGWDSREFMRQTCVKAGLNPLAFEQSHVRVYRFEAEVFHQACL